MTARSTPPEGMGTQTFHGLTGDAGFSGKEEGEAAGVFERGLRLGRYLVLGLLGRGGMGEVYVAYDPELDRKVALKMLYGGWSAGRESQMRLLHEAQAAARLTHPNVVRVYDVGSVGDRIFVAMELIDGVDLAAWTRAQSRSWREVLRVFREAGLGLAAAHAAGLVHRDFKPGNVLVAGDGRVVVADFGLALVAGSAVAVARALPTLAECSDRRALLAVEPFSTHPALQKRISWIREALARGRVLESAGRYSEALAVAEAATRAADALGDRPRAAEARLVLATTNGRKGRAEAMESTLLDAVDLAQESRHDRVLAQALTLLILASDVRGDPERARLWGRLAGSALKRIGTPGEIAADRRFYLGIAANMERRPEQAIEHFQASLSLAARAGSRKSTHTAFNNISIALNQLGRFDEAADHLRRALQILERNFGPDLRVLNAASDNLGIVIKENLGWSPMRDSSVTVSGGSLAMGISYLEASTNHPLILDNVIVVASGASGPSIGIGLHPGSLVKPTSTILFQGGRILGSTDGVSFQLAAVSVELTHTEVEASRYCVQAANARLYFVRVKGACIVEGGASEQCAATVNSAGAFLPNTCP